MSCRTGCCKKFSLVFALLALALLAAPAFGQGTLCMQAQYKADGQSQKLNCTANDVRISFADNPRHLDGTLFDATHGCQKGSTFSFVADFHVVTTATQRENIGLYFQVKGGSSAISGANGTCWDNVITPPHHLTGDLVCLGSGTGGLLPCPTGAGANGTYEELDALPDSCGDISTSDNNQVITVEVDNALCEPGPDGMLRLPNAVSWQQQGGTILCQSSPSSYPFDANAIPGSPSKCNHNDLFEVPIVVQSPTVSVMKACSTPTNTGTTTSCNFGVVGSGGTEGGTATYTITVANTSSFGTLTLNDICDTYYGTIALASGSTAQPCWGTGSPAGTPNADSSNTCTGFLPKVLQPSGSTGDTFTCQFTAAQVENTIVNDVAYGYGVGSDGTTGFSNHSTQVTVTSTEAASSATITKTWNNTTAACATVRYEADVANTSAGDETVTISTLTDDGFNLNSITQTNTPIVGTTCGVTTGIGTLTPVCDTAVTHTCTSGKVGIACTQTSDCAFTGGAFGSTPYTCYFDAQFCGALSGGSSCISHKDTVHGTFTGDESGDIVSSSDGTVTVQECVTTTIQ